MKLKITLCFLLIPIIVLLGLMIKDLSKMDSETLILCASGESGILIPNHFCKYYLYNHRDIQSDVKELSQGAGLEFILNGDTNERYEIAEFYISNGLNVNGINNYGGYKLTPIFGAILFNDLNTTQFLLDHKADLSVKPESINMTPLEFCKSLVEKEPEVDRSKILALLSNSL